MFEKFVYIIPFLGGGVMMGFGKIIAIVVAIPTFIVAVIALGLSSWLEGLITESLLQGFGVSPIIIGLVTIVGFLLLFLGIFKLASAAF